MRSFTRTAPRVKRNPVQPVKAFTVLFDGTKKVARPFIGRMPKSAPVKAAPVVTPAPEFTAAEMRRIDDARRSAFFDALEALGGTRAAEYAADRAEEMVGKIRAAKVLAERAAAREPVKPVATQKRRGDLRAPYTAADSLWWAQHCDEPDWDRLADERRAEDRVTCGAAG